MPTLREWLDEGPFALALSSGFFGFYAHAGVVSVLDEEGFRPTQISGSSAGALVGGCWASGLDPQAIQDTFFELRRQDFWDPAPGLGLLRGKLFRERLRATLPVAQIDDCPTPFRPSVFDVFGRRTRVLDRGPLAEAIAASCALPGLFQPVRLKRRAYLDGGIADRPGLLGAPSEGRVLYHHLVSRSWYRGSNVNALPQRRGLEAIVIEDLPRVNPYKLDAGRDAFWAARKATQKALNQPLRGS